MTKPPTAIAATDDPSQTGATNPMAAATQDQKSDHPATVPG